MGDSIILRISTSLNPRAGIRRAACGLISIGQSCQAGYDATHRDYMDPSGRQVPAICMRRTKSIAIRQRPSSNTRRGVQTKSRLKSRSSSSRSSNSRRTCAPLPSTVAPHRQPAWDADQARGPPHPLSQPPRRDHHPSSAIWYTRGNAKERGPLARPSRGIIHVILSPSAASSASARFSTPNK